MSEAHHSHSSEKRHALDADDVAAFNVMATRLLAVSDRLRGAARVGMVSQGELEEMHRTLRSHEVMLEAFAWLGLGGQR